MASQQKRPIQIGFSAESRELDLGLDLNSYLISHPSATFFFRLGESTIPDLNLNSQDILIVDRSLDPGKNSIVILSTDEGFLLANKINEKYKLLNSKCLENEEINGSEVIVWGCVIGVVRDLRKRKT